jgi:hypothetical protein
MPTIMAIAVPWVGAAGEKVLAVALKYPSVIHIA